MTSPFTAGQKLHASDLNFFIVGAACNSSLTLNGGAVTDISGATVTFTTTHTNVVVTCTGIFDMQANSFSSVAAAIGHLSVDGSDQTTQAIFVATATNQRACVSQCWTITLASSGSHTLKLRANGGSAGSQYSVLNPHTTINALVCDL